MRAELHLLRFVSSERPDISAFCALEQQKRIIATVGRGGEMVFFVGGGVSLCFVEG